MSQNDNQGDNYECNKCGATFNTEEELNEHNREEHDMDV